MIFYEEMEKIDAIKDASTSQEYKELVEAAEEFYDGLTEDQLMMLPDEFVKALEDAQEGDTIYLEAGTYADDLALNKGVKLYGPNFYFTGSERNAEAEFTGKITLAAGLKGVELVGFKFSGNAQIVNTLGEAGAADNLKTNLD